MAHYKGFLSAYQYTNVNHIVYPYRLNHGSKVRSEVIPDDQNIKVWLDTSSIVPNTYRWKEKRHRDDCNYLGFENCVFFAKFEIGSPRGTASSCECEMICPDFTTTMFLSDLWPYLHKITYDTTDPTKVRKFLEGNFTFKKQGSAVALIGVPDVIVNP